VASLSLNPAAMLYARAKRINGVFENARFGVGFNFHVIRQAGEGQLKFINACRDISEIAVLLSFRMDLQARVASYAILSRRAKAENMRASDRGVARHLMENWTLVHSGHIRIGCGSRTYLLPHIAPSKSTCGPSIASNPYMVTFKHQG
jgi:hypothetical protein